MQFRYSLRRYFAFQMDNNGGNTSLNARSFINNLDNRYNYVNLTEGKRRVPTLLLSGSKKASNSRHEATSIQRPLFFFLSLSPFTVSLATIFTTASRFFTNLATSVARQLSISRLVPTKWWKRSHRAPKFFSITEKKKTRTK